MSVPMTAAMYRDGSYLRNNETWHVEDSPWKARQIVQLLARNRLEFASFCEVGCGVGEILRQLSAVFTAARFVGYEVSPQAYRLCLQRQSERVSFRQADLLAEETFHDCLLCIDVFEHVEDYMKFIRALRNKATCKIFHIPLDLSAMAVLRGELITQRQSVGHLHYFSRDTALATLRDCGYEIVDDFYTPHFLDWPAVGAAARLKRATRKLLFRLAPDFAVKFWGGCSLLVLAR